MSSGASAQRIREVAPIATMPQCQTPHWLGTLHYDVEILSSVEVALLHSRHSASVPGVVGGGVGSRCHLPLIIPGQTPNGEKRWRIGSGVDCTDKSQWCGPLARQRHAGVLQWP